MEPPATARSTFHRSGRWPLASLALLLIATAAQAASTPHLKVGAPRVQGDVHPRHLERFVQEVAVGLEPCFLDARARGHDPGPQTLILIVGVSQQVQGVVLKGAGEPDEGLVACAREATLSRSLPHRSCGVVRVTLPVELALVEP